MIFADTSHSFYTVFIVSRSTYTAGRRKRTCTSAPV